MSETSHIDTANKWTSFFNSTLSIIILFGSGIVFCTIAYIMIFQNQSDIESLKKDKEMTIKMIEDKGDKRYQDAMVIAFEMKGTIKEQENRIRILEMEVAYLKGKLIKQ